MVVWLLEDLFKAAFRGLRCSLFQEITQTPVPGGPIQRPPDPAALRIWFQ